MSLKKVYFWRTKTYLMGVLSGLLVSTFFPLNLNTIGSSHVGLHRDPLVRDTPRLLCWVLTSPANKFKAEMVKETWGRRCDKLLFMSSEADDSLPAIGLPVTEESRSQLWNKVKFSLRHIYGNYLEEFEWFLKADDDTYVVVENLRELMLSWNESLPVCLGRKFFFGGIPFLRSTYHSGGAGYLLTRESIRLFVEEGLDRDRCQVESEAFEDVNIGQCLRNVGVDIVDSRDQFGRQRFIPYHIDEFYSGLGPNMDFLRSHDPDGLTLGYDCCSDRAVTFHYVSGHHMQVYEYLLYKLKIANV